MCVRYITPESQAIEAAWGISGRTSNWVRQLHPRSHGPFIRRADAIEPAAELALGQWALIPHFAKSPKLPYATVNARSEELAQKASYKGPWARGQRCIIPAESFDEPCWESGKNVWWRFRRADGRPWGIAGLWNTWTSRETGEFVESYTMLTLNDDAHPLMSRMHKPDPKLAPDKQDKRSLVLLEEADFERWLYGNLADAQKLMKLTPAELFDTGPAA